MRETIRAMFAAAVAVGALLPAGGAGAAGKELNLYSARHYQTDEALYEEFTKKTGITINRIEASGDKLMARLKSEGANSPADVFITVDAGNLWRADREGLFQPVTSAELEKRIPKHLRHPEGRWFGFSTRARVIVFNKDRVKDPAQAARYEDLADPKWKGQVCIRSSDNIYNLSLMASLIQHLGEAKAEAWAKGVVANFARQPKGGDTDQIKAVAAGECALGLANTYYYVRLLKSPKDKDVASKVGVIFPNQKDRGTHVNVSGAGVLKHAPNKENAIKFLEYLASDFAQAHFASGNNEYPVVATATVDATLAALGEFKSDRLGVDALGAHQPLAQKVYDRAAWK